MTVRNVSDTARWVAWYRAVESARPDAIFHDPYARRLAGERGEQIVRSLPGARRMGWVMVVRTALFDELVLRAIARDGVDTVLNLAAGFDTRPFRLELPASLRWIEVDLPPLIEEKRAALAGEVPRCALEQVSLDLVNVDARRALFARIGSQSKRVLVLSEGLLAYLWPDDVSALARDLHQEPSLQWWATDLASPFILQQVLKQANQQLKQAGAEMHFAPEEGPEFFRPAGWEAEEFRLMSEGAARLGREPQLAWLFRFLSRLMSPARRAAIEKRYRSGVVLLRRT